MIAMSLCLRFIPNPGAMNTVESATRVVDSRIDRLLEKLLDQRS
jgi:hypothetical protein